MWRPIAFLALTSLGLAWYVRRQHQHYLQAVKQQTGAVGQAAIGGPFRLLNAKTQRPFLSIVDARDKLLVLYFGFTHCPDICPEELDKLSKALRLLSATERSLLTPVFVTVDPERDGPAELAAYMRDFDPQIIPLTGTIDEISQVAKAFRVYYRRSSTLTDAKDDKKDKADANDDKTRTAKMETKPATDYLLDHSIFTYLMDKKGEFVQVFGKDSTPEGMAAAIREQLAKDLKN